MNIWVDIINPSHALFFNSLMKEFDSEEIIYSVRDRAETIDLVNLFNLEGLIIGRDYRSKMKKSFNMIYRTLDLYFNIKKFDYAFSFENGMSILVSKLKKKKSILFCDNDLKFIQKKSSFQDLETKFKSLADTIIIPKACYEVFRENIQTEKLITFDGYKEDIYLADYKPDPNFMDQIPYDNYVVVRPEALGSFYIKEHKSIIKDILKLFLKEHVNIIYLPREKEDVLYTKNLDLYIPEKGLNGLDLCYHSDGVLTGSGTMAREAACMNKTAVSFFPSNKMLSVDEKLMLEGKMFHSRDPEKILKYVLSKNKKYGEMDLERCKIVRDEIVKIIKDIIKDSHN